MNWNEKTEMGDEDIMMTPWESSGRGEGGGVSVEDKWTLDSKCAYLIFFVGPNEVCHSVLWSLLSAACKELQIDSRWRKDLEGSGFSCYGALC